MNKDYMLMMIKDRLKELEKKYRMYFDTDTGPSKSKSGAACIRSRINKQILTLRLLEHIVLRCPGNLTIDSDDLIKAFMKLVEGGTY